VVADKGLEDYIQNLRIIDSHEHLRSEEDRISTNPRSSASFSFSLRFVGFESTGMSFEEFLNRRKNNAITQVQVRALLE
jgi:hypothetical protein